LFPHFPRKTKWIVAVTRKEGTTFTVTSKLHVMTIATFCDSV